MSKTNRSSGILDPPLSCCSGIPFSPLFSTSLPSIAKRKEQADTLSGLTSKSNRPLSDPVPSTSYCPPHSPCSLPVFTYSFHLPSFASAPTTHCTLGSPPTTSLKLSSIVINKCCHQIPGVLRSCHSIATMIRIG